MVPILVVALGGYAAVCLLVFLLQARLVWFPAGAVGAPPSDPRGEERRFATSDGVELHGWWFPCEGALGAVLVCHGNAGNLSHRLHLAGAFLDMDLAVLLFDYRGYGRSAGAPSEEGTYLDAEAAHAAVVAEGFAPERVVAYGESLGAAVAIELARRRPLAAVVAESAFTSIPDVGAAVYPWLPVRLLARIRYDNLSKIDALRAPLLLVHSPEDEIVPFAHAERLRERSGAELLATGAGHNDGGFVRRPEWRERVRSFLWAALDG